MKPDMKSDGQSDASLMGGLDGPPRRRYLDYERERAAQLIGGAMLQTRLDLTHPMAFGISRPELAVFRTHSSLLSPSDNPYETFGVYTAQPWLSGYVSPRNVERLANQTAMRAQRFGDGAIIQLADNPTFRGYWLGGQKLILNAIFFGPTIKTTSAPYTWE